MNIICSNITQMDSCAEILDLNSKFGKDCDDPCEIDFAVHSNEFLCRNMK
jgi:hypothetical protein